MTEGRGKEPVAPFVLGLLGNSPNVIGLITDFSVTAIARYYTFQVPASI
jgi:hypothetical protein